MTGRGGVSILLLLGNTSNGKGSTWGLFRLSRTIMPKSKAGLDSSKPKKYNILI